MYEIMLSDIEKYIYSKILFNTLYTDIKQILENFIQTK